MTQKDDAAPLAYTIAWAGSSLTTLTSGTLPDKVVLTIWEFINGPLAREPFRVGAQLSPPLYPQYKATRADYRVVYLIDNSTRTVTIVSVAHRSVAYKSQQGRGGGKGTRRGRRKQ